MSSKATAGIWILVGAGIIYSFIAFYTPLAFDDWIFMAEWRDVNGSMDFSLQGLLAYWEEIRLYDNGRISNLLAPFSTIFSPWKETFPVLTGFATAAIVGFVSRFSFGCNWKSVFYIILSWVTMLYLLPWRDSLFVADYALNYIWASLVTLSLIAIALYFEKNGWTARAFLFAIFMAALAGGWHEGFAVPTLCGFILLTVAKGFRFSRQWWIIGVIYFLSTLFFYCCPGMLSRTGAEFGIISQSVRNYKALADFFPIVLLIILLAGYSLFPAGRARIRECLGSRICLVGLGIIVVGTFIGLVFNHHPRSAFWPDLFAVILILRLTSGIWRRLAASAYKGYLAMLMAVVTLLPLFATLTWQYRLWVESGELLSEMERSESGTVFQDITPPEAIPLYTLKIPSRSVWVTPFHYHSLQQFNGKSHPAVVPEALRGASFDVAESIPGTTDLRRFGGRIIGDGNRFSDILLSECKVKTTAGEELTFPVAILPFKTENGETPAYIIPYGIRPEDIAEIKIENSEI